MRFVRDDANPALYDALVDALDAVELAAPDAVRGAGLAGAWRIVAELGFAPALDFCSVCHAELQPGEDVLFSHPAGGALCAVCARSVPGRRTLPARARDALRGWQSGATVTLESDAEGRAHQRLLREFLHEHLHDARPLRAYEVWERERWGA
jgi:DNA repair protein RecO (recombination protein O)